MLRHLPAAFLICATLPACAQQTQAPPKASKQLVSPRMEATLPPSKRLDDECGGDATRDELACKIAFNTNLRHELRGVHAQVRKSLQADYPNDNTASLVRLLQQSQRAWETYTRTNCELNGRLEGGSDLWENMFAVDCEQQALRERIKVLRTMAGETPPDTQPRPTPPTPTPCSTSDTPTTA